MVLGLFDIWASFSGGLFPVASPSAGLTTLASLYAGLTTLASLYAGLCMQASVEASLCRVFFWLTVVIIIAMPLHWPLTTGLTFRWPHQAGLTSCWPLDVGPIYCWPLFGGLNPRWPLYIGLTWRFLLHGLTEIRKFNDIGDKHYGDTHYQIGSEVVLLFCVKNVIQWNISYWVLVITCLEVQISYMTAVAFHIV